MLPELADYSTFSQPPSFFTHHSKRRKQLSALKQRIWCNEVLILTTHANTHLPEKILWDRAIQAAQEGACTHLVPEVHSDGNPPVQERLNVVPPAWKPHKKTKETIAVAYSEMPWMDEFRLHQTSLALYLHQQDHGTSGKFSLFKYRSSSCTHQWSIHTTTQCLRELPVPSNRQEVEADWPKISQKISYLLEKSKQNSLRSQPNTLSRRPFKPLFAGHCAVPPSFLPVHRYVQHVPWTHHRLIANHAPEVWKLLIVRIVKVHLPEENIKKLRRTSCNDSPHYWLSVSNPPDLPYMAFTFPFVS